MKERIKEILSRFQINQTEFAAKVGISKAAISHIMSEHGRGGNLSQQTIERILAAFPTINRKWFVTGVGQITDAAQEPDNLSLFDQKNDQANTSANKPTVKEPAKTVTHEQGGVSDYRVSYIANQAEPVENKQIKQETRRTPIDRIVIFYKDGTFTEHLPQKANEVE